MKNKFLILSLIGSLLFVALSCTKLDEQPYLYDRVTGDQFGKTDLEISSAVGAAYSNLAGIGGNNHWNPLGEVTADEEVVPTRGTRLG
ncbi:MAG: hypothetical protein QM764_04885 [Chitinophagaceae bacterium]